MTRSLNGWKQSFYQRIKAWKLVLCSGYFAKAIKHSYRVFILFVKALGMLREHEQFISYRLKIFNFFSSSPTIPHVYNRE